MMLGACEDGEPRFFLVEAEEEKPPDVMTQVKDFVMPSEQYLNSFPISRAGIRNLYVELDQKIRFMPSAMWDGIRNMFKSKAVDVVYVLSPADDTSAEHQARVARIYLADAGCERDSHEFSIIFEWYPSEEKPGYTDPLVFEMKGSRAYSLALPPSSVLFSDEFSIF